MEDSNLSQGDESLYQVVVELEVSERKYHEQLSYLSDLYILHLKTCVISGEEIEQMLLTKIKDMMEISLFVSEQLQSRLEKWDGNQSLVGDIFLNQAELWDIYGSFSKNLESALGKYDEKMMSADFAALVSLKQGLDNVSLKDLILLPMQRLKQYREFFDKFLEKAVGVDFIFNHPDFSNVMECRSLVEKIIPTNFDELAKRKQFDEYKKIESMLGDQLGSDFSAYIKHIHEEPASSKRWKKRSYKKTPRKIESGIEKCESSDGIEIGGKKFKEDAIAPDILNALKKEKEKQVMIGLVSPTPELKERNYSSADNYVATESRVTVRWENEVHKYSIILFKQCMILAKVRSSKMKISRIIKLRSMWVSEEDCIGFPQVEKKENCFTGGWTGTEDWSKDEVLMHRVIFNFPNRDIRKHWYTLLQRYIKQSCEKCAVPTGQVKVYFKGSDSKLSVPSDSTWQGMSCQDLQIDIKNSVDEVIEQAVTQCQMTSNTYTLTFMLQQTNKIVFDEQLIRMEKPLVIQNDLKSLFTEDTHFIFLLQPHVSDETAAAPSRQRLSTLTTFFRKGGRAASASYSRLSNVPERSFATHTTNRMFGVALSRFMNDNAEEIPAPLLDLLMYIYTFCYNSEGIFRVPGSRAVQRAIEEKLDTGQTVDWNTEQSNTKCYLPNVASSLLKQYFRSLPNGILPKRLFPELERWRADGCQLEEFKTCILPRVPDVNITVIRHTVHVLKRIVEYGSVNLMTVQSLSTCIGPSLVTWPEDGNALSIHADAYRRQTPSVVVAFLLEHAEELFGPSPAILSRNILLDDEVISRRSKQSLELAESSDDEGDKTNMWLRSLLRSSINEQGASMSTSSSMFVEIGSPILVTRDRTPSPVFVPHALITPISHIQTCHSQPLQSPQSIDPEQCDLPDITPTETESRRFFGFPGSRSKSRSSKTEDVGRKKGSSLRRSRKNKKLPEVAKYNYVSDASSEEELKHKEVERDGAVEEFAIKEETKSISSIKRPKVRVKLTEEKIESFRDLDNDTAIKKVGSSCVEKITEEAKIDDSGNSKEGKTPEKLTAGNFRRDAPGRRGIKSPHESAEEFNFHVMNNKEDIQKIKEHSAAKRVLVRHHTSKQPALQHTSDNLLQERWLVGAAISQNFVAPRVCTTLSDQHEQTAKEGHQLAQLVEGLRTLTNPRLAGNSTRHFGGSIGTESGTSSNDEEGAPLESYV